MISQSFAGARLDINIDSISASQAAKILYRLIAQGMTLADVAIRGDGKDHIQYTRLWVRLNQSIIFMYNYVNSFPECNQTIPFQLYSRT